MKDSGDTSVEITAPKFSIHKFIDEITEKKIIFQVIKMLDSIFIYINDKDSIYFNDLSLAMQSRFDNSPVGSKLIGSFIEETSKEIACRLSKKVKKTVFLSCNIEANRILMPLVEKRLYEEIRNYPDKF